MTPNTRQPDFRIAKLLVAVVVCGVIAAAAGSWHSGGIVHDLTRQDLGSAEKLERLRQFFLAYGSFAPVVYVAFVIVEVVVAPIPGLMLYAPGGIIFGPVVGGALSLLGNVIGAGVACSVTRMLGSTWLSRFFDERRLEHLQTKVEAQGMWLIFLLRINPLTSSDMISYAAGFTRIPIWKVTAATAFGMAPLCFAQAWLADGLLTAIPELVYPLVVVCLVYLVFVIVVLRKMLTAAV
ncbi:MAG: TVP38/TMEM64 family protein [Fuerstiella sp.]|nr:TVP38/TMEM64 family protein [Fuerstiella sp.]